MSMRRAERRPPPAPISVHQPSTRSLEEILRAGQSRRTQPAFTTTTPALTRRVLLLKGLTWGVTESAYAAAMAEARRLVEDRRNPVTTIVWDGDKQAHPDPAKDGRATDSFTHVVVWLQQEYPHLEFIFFKKPGKAKGLVSGMGAVEYDNYKNLLGPYSFMTARNTTILDSTATPPPLVPGHNLGVEIPDVVEWYDLGVLGFKWLRTHLGVAHVDVLILGVGGNVKEEMNKVAETPHEYPRGYTQTDATSFHVDR